MSWGKERIAQLQLPNPEDDDPHPRLLLEGDGVHAGQGFTALFPDGWHDITMEVSWEPFTLSDSLLFSSLLLMNR